MRTKGALEGYFPTGRDSQSNFKRWGREQGAGVDVCISAEFGLAVSSRTALRHSEAVSTVSHEEAGADTFANGGAEAYKPFANLSRGF